MACRLKEDVLNKNDELEDLLVFGYSCKLFRDDEKALYIDQGKHLIPWMGDETLKIDRYDARGTLYDLKNAEAPSGGFDRFFGLTDIEKQVESMCDEERYRALVTNEEEESMYQEEELKRLHFALGDKSKEYGQVQYNYDGNSNNVMQVTEKSVEKTDEGGEDEPFVPAPQLDIPLNMVVPETVKHNAVIVKTAMFINSQGPQMEILLKMKQAGNPLFNFLSFDNPLHNYYRHLLMAIKGGQYKPDVDKSNDKKDEENGEDDHYLHPSLASSVSKVELAPSIPSINYKPSAHCAYSMLVNKIKDKKAKSNVLPSQLTKLKQALQRFNTDKKDDNSGNESDSNCSTESRSSVKSKSSSYSNISLGSLKSSQANQSFETPPHDIQIIIDKMASYVAKNGRDFETVVQMKKDPRFDFLNANHVFNSYYQYKVRQYENIEKLPKPDERSKSIEMKMKEEQAKAKLTPVCFSIKKPKESETVIEKSALPLEESSDEEGRDDEKKENMTVEEAEKKESAEVVASAVATVDAKEEKNKKILATERIKDKLTAAVREKVAMASKEKQLQLERKRRAAAFLKNLQSEGGGLKIPMLQGPQLPGCDASERVTDDDSDVASLPDGTDEIGSEEKNVKCEKRTKHFREVEKSHKLLCSTGKHKDREKQSEKKDEGKSDVHDRTSDSSVSSEDNDRRKNYGFGRRSGRRKSGEDSYTKSKFVQISGSHSDEKRRKRRKHKKDDERDRNTRKHSRSKKSKRSKGSDDERNFRIKRSRRDSDSSDSDRNS
ncbi:UNVERIFIED_CONTAM: hypothetical protein PYX00_008841 [Menopon gallinae]|uniref:SURP motif domain-containing protein n=1 Tax=Menopon gallinae TaxID=328185 RepID=A0AAW2H9L2_9NEOP